MNQCLYNKNEARGLWQSVSKHDEPCMYDSASMSYASASMEEQCEQSEAAAVRRDTPPTAQMFFMRALRSGCAISSGIQHIA